MSGSVKKHFFVAIALASLLFVALYVLSDVFGRQSSFIDARNLLIISVFIFGLYLAFVVGLFFNQSYRLWSEGLPWKRFFIYSLLIEIIFSLYLPLLGLASQGEAIEYIIYALPIGIVVAVPAAFYNIFLGIKALRKAKAENISLNFGLIMLILSTPALIISALLLWGLYMVAINIPS